MASQKLAETHQSFHYVDVKVRNSGLSTNDAQQGNDLKTCIGPDSAGRDALPCGAACLRSHRAAEGTASSGTRGNAQELWWDERSFEAAVLVTRWEDRAQGSVRQSRLGVSRVDQSVAEDELFLFTESALRSG